MSKTFLLPAPLAGLRVHLVALVTLLALLTACSEETAGTEAVELKPCQTSSDCLGGELCISSQCRETCSSSGPPCVGPLSVCNPAVGLCTGCLSDEDCGSGSCIQERCAAGCSSDDACPEGQSCSDGRCEARTCDINLDCRGGELCRDGVCTVIESVQCAPGSQRCEGSLLARCALTGDREDIQACQTGQTCQEDGGTARCATSTTCTPGSIGCHNANTRWTCSEAGSRDNQTCGMDERCENGRCITAACSPASARCEGSRLIVCDPTGTFETPVDCNSTEECSASDFGCACRAGACAVNVCRPGSGRCVEGAPERCVDGDAYVPVSPCSETESCRAGACVPTSCAGSDSLCADDTLLLCLGGTWDETDCDAFNQTCQTSTSGARCVDRVCAPGQRTCTDGNRAVSVCNSTGTALDTTTCGQEQFCRDGVCINRICTPDSLRCGSGGPERCNSTGSAWTPLEGCRSDEICRDGDCVTDNAQCQSAADCPPPANACDGNTLVTYTGNGSCSSARCSYDNVRIRTPCAENERCDAALVSCVERTSCNNDRDCAGDRRCLRNTDNPDGRCVECLSASDCNEDQTCSSNNCIFEGEADCRTDSECVSRARALGATDTTLQNVRCDEEVGCFTLGRCGPLNAESTRGDIFNSRCRTGTVCGDVLGFTTDRCSLCTIGGPSSCRNGEVCREGILPGFGDSCAPEGSGGDLPFPF